MATAVRRPFSRTSSTCRFGAHDVCQRLGTLCDCSCHRPEPEMAAAAKPTPEPVGFALPAPGAAATPHGEDGAGPSADRQAASQPSPSVDLSTAGRAVTGRVLRDGRYAALFCRDEHHGLCCSPDCRCSCHPIEGSV